MSPLHAHPLYAWAIAAAFVTAVFAPTLAGRSDSFPLSTYPMFAKHRGKPELVKMIATDGEHTTPIKPDWLGTGEVLQAKVLLQQIAAKPAAQRKKFCARVAARLALDPQAAPWVELKLSRVRVDPVEYILNGGTPLREDVLTRCPLRAVETSEEAR